MGINNGKAYNGAIKLALIVSLVCISSCTSYIDREPLSSISIDEGYLDESSLENALTGIYSGFYNLASSFVTLTELRSDNFTHYQWLQEAYSDNNFGSYDSDGLWDGLFSIISRANILLQKIEGFNSIENKEEIIGQARFLRAYAYFWLVRVYGDVPIAPVSFAFDSSFEIPRSTTADVYKFIEEDLIFCINNLKSDIVFGKANKYVAEAELAKVYIMESGYPVNNNKYKEAKILLEDIIESGEFALEDKYQDVFTLEGEKGKEIIWSAIMDPSSRGHHHSGQYIIDPKEPDLVMACSPEFKPGQNPLLGDLWLSFEDGDQRRDVSLDSSSYDPTGAYRRQINCAKYKYGYEEGIGWTSDYIFLRYANVLLMYAECLHWTNESSVIGNKWDIINQVRNRAGLSDLVLPKDEDFMNILLDEDRHEFVWEGTRWFDLIRTNTFVEKLKNVGHTNVRDFWKFLPIPINEMDKMNGFWKNNDGY